jgi:hypothetical protein
MDVPPHLMGARFDFAESATLGSEVLVVHPVPDVDRGNPRCADVWPLLTDEERHLVLAASLLLRDGALDMEGVALFDARVMLWQDGEIWVPVYKIRTRFRESRRGQDKSAETV